MNNYLQEIKNIDQDILDIINRKLSEGKDLISSAREGTVTPYHFEWIDSFSSIIDVIDPFGESFSNSIKARWNSAEYYYGNYPKKPKEEAVVFCQKLAVINSLLFGKVSTVKSKVNDISSNCIYHKRSLPIQENLVFVLMPFSEKWSDFVWKNGIKHTVENIENLNMICRRADNFYGADVMQDIYENILTASIIIADITNKNPNVFYELGIAHTLGKDVILLTQDVEDIPSDLRRYRHCIYSNDGEGYEKLSEYIPNAINEIISKRINDLNN